MTKAKSLWRLASAAALACGSLGTAVAQPAGNDVRAGIDAWAAQNYDEAVRIWRPLADRGDEDAQYNIAQAYFLGRGVPQNMVLAEQWYERAARQGHAELAGAGPAVRFLGGNRERSGRERGRRQGHRKKGLSIHVVSSLWGKRQPACRAGECYSGCRNKR